MVNEGDYVAIFNSVHRVMKAEKLLKERQLPMLLIPAPRTLSADCGLAIRYGADDRPAIESLLRGYGLMPEEIHCRTADGFLRIDE